MFRHPHGHRIDMLSKVGAEYLKVPSSTEPGSSGRCARMKTVCRFEGSVNTLLSTQKDPGLFCKRTRPDPSWPRLPARTQTRRFQDLTKAWGRRCNSAGRRGEISAGKTNKSKSSSVETLLSSGRSGVFDSILFLGVRGRPQTR